MDMMGMPVIIRVMMLIGRSVTMPAMLHLGGDQMQIPVPHAGLGDRLFGELPDGGRRPPQQNDLQAILMVEMDMQRRKHQVVVAVLRLGQTARQFPLMMIIDIAEAADRIFGVAFFFPVGFKTLAQQIADRLGAVFIPLAADEAVELLQKSVIQGNAHPFHPILLAGNHRERFSILPAV